MMHHRGHGNRLLRRAPVGQRSLWEQPRVTGQNLKRGYADTCCGQVHYLRSGTGRKVMLIHQSPWSSRQFHAVVPLLATSGYDVLVPDLPGFGMSDSGCPARVESYADALSNLIDALSFAPCAVVGHHTGALVAAALAARPDTPAIAAVLDNAPCYTPDERAAREQARSAASPLKPDGSHFTDRWALLKQRGDPALSDASIDLAVRAWSEAGRHDGHRAAFSFDLVETLARVRTPVLVVQGLRDPLVDHAERILALLPSAEHAQLAGGAAAMLEEPSTWTAAIQPFLNRAYAQRLEH
jgi:pimeloyl-ACP methyl ester carboxylesterase